MVLANIAKDVCCCFYLGESNTRGRITISECVLNKRNAIDRTECQRATGGQIAKAKREKGEGRREIDNC